MTELKPLSRLRLGWWYLSSEKGYKRWRDAVSKEEIRISRANLAEKYIDTQPHTRTHTHVHPNDGGHSGALMEECAGIGGDKIEYIFVGQRRRRCPEKYRDAGTAIKSPRGDVYCHSRSGAGVKGSRNFKGARAPVAVGVGLPLLLMLLPAEKNVMSH